MSKKQPVVINYNGLRLALDTIAGFLAIYSNGKHERNVKYGIRFFLRSGQQIEQLGTDERSRDKMMAFMDKHLNAQKFPGNKCQVCANWTRPDRGKTCATPGCGDWERYPKFKREKDAAI